jgi:hypothetical protein
MTGTGPQDVDPTLLSQRQTVIDFHASIFGDRGGYLLSRNPPQFFLYKYQFLLLPRFYQSIVL